MTKPETETPETDDLRRQLDALPKFGRIGYNAEASAKLVFKTVASLERRLRAAESAVQPSDEALKLAQEFVSDPDIREQVKVKLREAGFHFIAEIIDEVVIVSRELLRISGRKER